MEFFKALDLYSNTGAQYVVELIGYTAVGLIMILLLWMFFEFRD